MWTQEPFKILPHICYKDYDKREKLLCTWLCSFFESYLIKVKDSFVLDFFILPLPCSGTRNPRVYNE